MYGFGLKNCSMNRPSILSYGMKKLSTNNLLITYYLFDNQIIIRNLLIFYKRLSVSEIMG